MSIGRRGGRAARSPRAVQTRERILDAAAHVLATKGYGGTRLSDIARVAEYPAPAMYYYFESRDEIVDEVMRLGTRVTREHVQAALDALPSDANRRERIEVAVCAHLEVNLRISDYSRASTRNMGQIPKSLRQRQMVEMELYGDVWRRLLDEAEAAGELSPEINIGVARMYVLGALNWVPEWYDAERGSVDEVIRSATALTCSALLGSAGSPHGQEAGVSDADFSMRVDGAQPR